jgi:hypothetical protein
MVMYKKILFDTVSRLVNGQNLTDGIEFILSGISGGESHQSEYKFTFNVKFTKDVSYQQSALDMLLYDVIDTAVQLLSLEGFRYDIELIGDDLESDHIGQDLYDDIDNTLSKINQVIMKFGYEYKNTIKIDVQHVDTEVDFTDDNSFKVTNIVKPIKGYYCYGDNNNKCNEVSVNDAVDEYLVMIRNRPYDDSDYNYLAIDELMETYTAFNDGNQVIFVLTQFEK